MTRFFICIYHWLSRHRSWMWILLLSTTALFAFFALQLHFEEDISKLLPKPKSEKTNNYSLAFNQLAIKEKLFIQIHCTDGRADAESLSSLSDEFAEALWKADSAQGLIAHLFYRLEDEWMLNGLDYAMEQLPCLTDTQVYAGFDSLLQASVLDDRMEKNAEIFENDMDGTASALTDQACSDSLSDIVSSLPNVIVADPYYYTDGMVSLVHESFNTIMLISSLFVLLVLLLSFRSISVSLLAFLPMFLSWYVVQGLMAIFGIEFNLINIILSSFIFGVGVDYSIFTMKGLLAGARGEGTSLLAHHRTAIILSAIILIIVASSLLLAKHPSVHSVGICTLIGMSASILFSYSLQPFLFRQMMKVNFFSKWILK